MHTMGDSYYEQAVICENGHIITTVASASVAHSAPFCQTCGASTVRACPRCKAFIRGSYIVQGVIGFDKTFPAPRCCYQ